MAPDLLKSVAFVQEKVIWITQKSGKIIREESKIVTSIYLVRHGQTAWNKEEIFRGGQMSTSMKAARSKQS